MRHFSLISILLILSACAEPLNFIPGGTLSGNQTELPALWQNIPETIQLETNLDDSYSVNIWGLAVGKDFYVATGEDGTTWSHNMNSDSRVVLRVGKNLYSLNAVEITESIERESVTQAYIEKYDVDKSDSWLVKGRIYRLDRTL